MVERRPKAIADALSSFLEDGNSAQRLAQAGHAYVSGNLDQQLSLDRYAEIYDELGALAARRLRG